MFVKDAVNPASNRALRVLNERVSQAGAIARWASLIGIFPRILPARIAVPVCPPLGTWNAIG